MDCAFSALMLLVGDRNDIRTLKTWGRNMLVGWGDLTAALQLLPPPPPSFLATAKSKTLWHSGISFASLCRKLAVNMGVLSVETGCTICCCLCQQLSIFLFINLPREGSGVVRMDPLRFLAGCRTRRLNQA